VFARELDVRGNLLHRQIADIRQRAAAGGAAGELGAAGDAHQVPAGALQDRWQHIVKAHGAFEQRGQIGGHARITAAGGRQR